MLYFVVVSQPQQVSYTRWNGTIVTITLYRSAAANTQTLQSPSELLPYTEYQDFIHQLRERFPVGFVTYPFVTPRRHLPVTSDRRAPFCRFTRGH